MRQEPLHKLQPFFAGINTGNGPTENQTTRPSGGNQWFTLRNRFFHFGVGITQNFIQNFLPTWVDGFGTG